MADVIRLKRLLEISVASKTRYHDHSHNKHKFTQNVLEELGKYNVSTLTLIDN